MAAPIRPTYSALLHSFQHDNVVHHPLGAGSYIFKQNLIQHLSHHCTKESVTIHIGSQPNNSPHMGTIVNFGVAFFIAAKLKTECGRPVSISLDLVDTAPSEQVMLHEVTYQRSQRCTREMDNYLSDFHAILEHLAMRTGVKYRVRTQAQFLSSIDLSGILRHILGERDTLLHDFSPREENALGIRAACPAEGCGLADKHSRKTVYFDEKIVFTCPLHREWTVSLDDPLLASKLEFNTPMRNIIRAKAFTDDPSTSWIHLPGADYAGYYQEQLLWRHLKAPYIIFYSPLILDWSGAKLSKSLYVKSGAYQYLKDCGMEYLVSFKEFRSQGKDLDVIFDEVCDWVQQPYKLFRSYSIAYIDALYKGEKLVDGSLSKV